MNPPVLISIVDRSTLAPDLAGMLPAIVLALAKQLANDVAPLWGRVLPALELASVPSAFASQIAILDDADAADALGYHDEDPHGRPYAKVFLRPILDNGGTIASGSNSVSAVLSHELLEMVGDAAVNLWADAPDGYSYALELCDAVEADAYEIDGISVSNFVLPAFFDGTPEGGERFDFLSKLEAPFSMTPGGYQIRRKTGGRAEQVFALAANQPEWRRAGKRHAAARTSRRICASTTDRPPPISLPASAEDRS